MDIAILYSLPTKRAQKTAFLETENDTIASAEEVAWALQQNNVRCHLIPAGEFTIASTIHNIHADVIFNLIDWTGLDVQLTLKALELLEKKRIPFTGASKSAFAHGTNKIQMKKMLTNSHIPTPRWQYFTKGNETIRDDFRYPVIVKLGLEHCSISMEYTSVVHTRNALPPIIQDRFKKFSQPVYIEEFLTGREIQATVYENDHGLTVLPPGEIDYHVTGDKAMLTYKSRWNEKDPEFHTSGVKLARLTSAQLKKVQSLCERTFQALGYHDYTRVDMRMDEKEQICILEANPNPGLSDDDLYTMTLSYRAAGMTFRDFIWKIVFSCLRRYKKAYLFPHLDKQKK